MATQTATGISTVLEMFKLQTRLFNNVVQDVTEVHAQQKLSEHTNHIAWLAGHLVSTRFMLANLAGSDKQEPYPDLFGKGKGIQDETYPKLADLTKDWASVSEELINKLSALSESALAEPAPFQLPIGDPSLLGAITFFAHHEAYTIGQIGIARRYFGYEAMKYA